MLACRSAWLNILCICLFAAVVTLRIHSDALTSDQVTISFERIYGIYSMDGEFYLSGMLGGYDRRKSVVLFESVPVAVCDVAGNCKLELDIYGKDIAGFGYYFSYGSDESSSSKILMLPHWFLLGMFAIYPIFSAMRFVHGRTVEAGCCRRYSYDLRASVARCPECGLQFEISKSPLSSASK